MAANANVTSMTAGKGNVVERQSQTVPVDVGTVRAISRARRLTDRDAQWNEQ